LRRLDDQLVLLAEIRDALCGSATGQQIAARRTLSDLTAAQGARRRPPKQVARGSAACDGARRSSAVRFCGAGQRDGLKGGNSRQHPDRDDRRRGFLRLLSNSRHPPGRVRSLTDRYLK
jgi:hypothetical protein